MSLEAIMLRNSLAYAEDPTLPGAKKFAHEQIASGVAMNDHEHVAFWQARLALIESIALEQPAAEQNELFGKQED